MTLFGMTVAFAALLLVRRKLIGASRFAALIKSLVVVDALLVLVVLVVSALGWLGTPEPAAAAFLSQQEGELTSGIALAAALSTGLAALASGIAVAVVGSAAVGAVSEDPDNLGRTLIFVGLAEGIAIYGLITSFLILTR